MQGKDYNIKNKRVKIRLSVLVFAITTFIIAIANPAIALNSQQYGIDSSFLAELQSKEMPDYDRPEAIEKGLVVENGHVARLYKKESDLRTVIFANKDGTETAYIFDEPVKYIDENGKIVDKSNRLYSVYADEYAYVNKDNDIRTYFPKTLDEKSGIKLEYGDISIEMLDLCQYFGHKKLNFFSLHNIDTERKIIKLQEPPLQSAVEFYNPVHCVSFCGYTKTQYIQRELFQPLQM
jgi:hypothetical protein